MTISVTSHPQFVNQARRLSPVLGEAGVVHQQRVNVSQALGRDVSIFAVEHRLVSLDQLDRHDRSGALMTAATSDVGDLTTEGSPVDGVERVTSGLADGQFVASALMSTLCAGYQLDPSPLPSAMREGADGVPGHADLAEAPAGGVVEHRPAVAAQPRHRGHEPLP